MSKNQGVGSISSYAAVNCESQNSMEDETVMTILGYWKFFLKYKVVIIGIAGIFCLGSVILALKSRHVYRASLVMIPIQNENTNGILSSMMSRYSGLASLAGVSKLGKEDITKSDEMMAILRSRVFVSRFIANENLMPKLFKKKWDEENKKWKVEPKKIPSKGKAYELFSKRMKVSSNRETGLITLTLDWTDSALVADLANKLIDQLNIYIKNQKVSEAQKNIEFLNAQLLSTNKVGDRAILYELLESNTKTIMLANVTDEFAFKVLDPAFVPEKRIKPKRKKMVLLGGMFGLGIGFLVAFAHSYIGKMREELALVKNEI